MTRRRAIRLLLALGVLLAVGGGASHVLAGPSGIHQRLLLAPRITICDRQYHTSGAMRTRAEIAAGGGPVLLVDPGILGLFAPCPPPDADGLRPCTTSALVGPCATVIHVRVGEDAYVTYELSGGP